MKSGANALKTMGQICKNYGAKWSKLWGKCAKNYGANLQRASNTQSFRDHRGSAGIAGHHSAVTIPACATIEEPQCRHPIPQATGGAD